MANPAEIVAVAEPVASPAEQQQEASDLALYLLQNQGYPLGLAKELDHSKFTYPLRFWIVDNSGSMMTPDGRELMGSNKQSLSVVTGTTRWKELTSTIEYHIGLANALGAHTVFRFLNQPSSGDNNNDNNNAEDQPELPQEFSIAPYGVPSDEATVADALRVVRSTLPAGVTPLTAHLQNITGRIKEVAPALRERSQKAVVVIATDGLPTDPLGNVNDDVKGDFVSALKLLQAQPVWIVIRLCTQNPEVVDFYNSLDKELESPLEVLDDFLGEATEIVKLNKWLNYTLPLHRCREAGYHHRVFDLLDEGKFNHDQLRSFVAFLFGRDNVSDPLVDWREFLDQVEEMNASASKEWNVKTEKLSDWFDTREMTKQFGPKGGFCAACYEFFALC